MHFISERVAESMIGGDGGTLAFVVQLETDVHEEPEPTVLLARFDYPRRSAPRNGEFFCLSLGRHALIAS
jgi:hypothetical protein